MKKTVFPREPPLLTAAIYHGLSGFNLETMELDYFFIDSTKL